MRRRIVAGVVVVGALLVGGQAASGALGGASLAPSERPTSVAMAQTVVKPGDSLWTVAKRLVPGRDPRPVVDGLAAARRGAPLVPGETVHWAR